MLFIMYWECTINMIRKIEADSQKDNFDAAWEVNDQSFDLICEYYEKHPELKVTCCKKGECDSHEK